LQGQEKYYIKINNIGLWDIQEEKYGHWLVCKNTLCIFIRKERK
jgi:hypothetical protein